MKGVRTTTGAGRRLIYGVLAAVTAALVAGMVMPAAAQDPQIDLDPDQGTAGSTFVVHGSGYPPNLSIQVRWEDGTVLNDSSITTDEQGEFNREVQVPPNASPREQGYQVFAGGQDDRGQWLAQATFTVDPTPEQSPPPQGGQPPPAAGAGGGQAGGTKSRTGGQAPQAPSGQQPPADEGQPAQSDEIPTEAETLEGRASPSAALPLEEGFRWDAFVPAAILGAVAALLMIPLISTLGYVCFPGRGD